MSRTRTGAREKLTHQDIFRHRSEIYAVFALWIVFFHCNSYVGFPEGGPVLWFIGKGLGAGHLGVDVFLFFSAAGMYQSFRKHSVREFYIHRIRRLVVPYLICAVVYYGWYDFVYARDGVLQFLLNTTTISWWTTGGIGRYGMSPLCSPCA